MADLYPYGNKKTGSDLRTILIGRRKIAEKELSRGLAAPFGT